MGIPLLYLGEYSQWVERFMYYLEEQTNGEEMMNSIKNGDQPLPRVNQVSITGTSSTEQPHLKDKSMWKAAVLYEYETFKATEGELLLDSYIRYLQVINDLKKCGYSKDKCELNFKFLNNLQPEWKQYATMTRQNKNLMDINIDSANKKQYFVKTGDKKVEKKMMRKKQDMSKVKCYNCKKEGHFAKDCKKVKVKDYEYYNTKMFLTEKDKDEQVLLAKDQAWMESSSDLDQEINANMVFMAQIEKVLSDLEASPSSADDKIFEVSYYLSESESESEYETSEYYDNTTTYGLFVTDNDDQEILHECENFPEIHIESQIDHNESAIDHNDSEGVDKLLRKFNKKIAKCLKRIEKANQQNKDFDKIDSPFQQTSSLKPYVPTVILEKIIIDLKDEVVSLLEKEKANLETIESLKSKGFESSENAIFESENQSENDCQVVEKECDQVENSKVIAPGMFKLNLDTISCVRRPKHSGVIWNKKGSSNTFNVDLSSVSNSKLKKDVKRYSRKDLLSCNISHIGETSSAYVCNDAMNVSCNSRLCDSFDKNNLFIFDDESVRNSPVSKMPFRKKPRDSMNIVQICLWIIDSGCSKHMMGHRALLTNFVENFLGTVRFGNNDFAVIAGYGDVGLEVAFRKSTCFVRNEYGVDLLTGDRSSNLYVVALNEVASNSSTCLPKMKFEKDHLCSACEQGKIHQKHHKSKMAFASNKPLYLLHMDLYGPMRIESINEKRYMLVVVDDYSQYTWVFFLQSKDEASEVIIYFIKKTQVNLQLQVQRVRTDNDTEFKNKTLAKFFDEFGITQQFFAARTPQQNDVVERRKRTIVEAARTILTFANLPLFLWAKAIATSCFTQNRLIIHKHFDKTLYELMNKRKPNIKFFRVFRCRCYLLNDYEDVGKLKTKGDIRVFIGYSRIMKSSTTNVETSNVEIPSHEEEVFHESSESFQEESSSSSLNNDVQQSPEEVILPQTNTQSISNYMVPNVDEASTLHNVFNERLEDAYFDTSTSFHDPSIEPTNVAEALRDADWVSAMQEELNQFARLKV
nr:hypothetical protein [Tanacetum cinerariifolium]